MLNKIKKITKFSSFLILSSFLKAEAQEYPNQGEGKVVLEEFMSIDKSPNLSVPYQTYTFYVNNFKILREESKIEEPKDDNNLDSLAVSTPFYDDFGNEGGTVKTSIKVRMLQPKYILDLKSKKAYIFGHKDGKICYYQEDLLDFGMDPYSLFFNFSKKYKTDYNKIQLTNNSKNIAGITCEEGLLYIDPKKKYQSNICFTKNKIPLKTPLDNMFNNTSPFSVLSGTFGMDGNEGKIVGYASFIVKEIKEQKIPDEKFEIPADAILLSKKEAEDAHIFSD